MMTGPTQAPDFVAGRLPEQRTAEQRDHRTALMLLHRFLAGWFRDKPVRIYEAGGGSVSWVPDEIKNRARISVVDIDEVQLENNNYADEKIKGDIQFLSFPAESFDLVVCYNVIEHLERPDLAIARFYDALATNGLLLIGAPNPLSLTGFATKYTPHWFHVWYFRFVLKQKHAGLPGKVPFRVYYHKLVAPAELVKFAEMLGFEVVYRNAYESPRYSDTAQAKPTLGRLLYVLTGALNALTFGRHNVRLGDYHLALRKRVHPKEQDIAAQVRI